MRMRERGEGFEWFQRREKAERERASEEQEERNERKPEGKVASLGLCVRNYPR